MKERGFTLLELAITTLIITITMIALIPIYKEQQVASKNAYVQLHTLNNQAIGQALLAYAANSTALGTFPTPYTGGGYTKTVYNPGDVSAAGVNLTQALTQGGLNPAQINSDGSAASNVRVYQLVSGLTQQVPLYFQSGPVVTLSFQYGVIYLTQCPIGTASCNPTAATGVPGSSAALTGVNYSTWASSGTDYPAAMVSTLPLQKNMLVTTVQRLDKVRDSLLGFLRQQQITALAGDATNWYPADGTDSLTGASPGTNQGCRDGWYSLSSSTVLASIDLSATEYGQTAWGGDVQYCRDYDVQGTKTPNASPHYAALRINVNVSSGIAPDSIVLGNNVVLTF